MVLDLDARGVHWRETPTEEQLASFEVLVIGAGMGGLAAAVQLKRAGINYTQVEKHADIGGTWWLNKYPGARVDTPSVEYSHSFTREYVHENYFGTREQNLEYMQWIVDTYDLRGNLEVATEVTGMRWDDTEKVWRVRLRTPDGMRERVVNAVIASPGGLHFPKKPDFPGMESFQGDIIHTAEWPDEYDPTGKRVAVIGSGASGYQIIPVLSKTAEHVTLFQRTPSWMIPIPNYLDKYDKDYLWLETYIPALRAFNRFQDAFRTGPAIAHLTEVDPNFDHPVAVNPGNQVFHDYAISMLEHKLGHRPEILEAMKPKNPPFSSRPLTVDGEDSVLDVLANGQCSLVTSGIKTFTPTGIESNDGSRHEFDLVVLATGFDVEVFVSRLNMVGKNGTRIEDIWDEDGPRAYACGTMYPDMPNFWNVLGPNPAAINGIGQLDFIELQVCFAVNNISELILGRGRAIETTYDAYRRYAEAEDEMEARGCWRIWRSENYSYYFNGKRSSAVIPINAYLTWEYLRDPRRTGVDLVEKYEGTDVFEKNPKAAVVRPFLGEDLVVS
ncbi:flavin-containing monooxygenase [Nocardia sp. NPDC004068]|uniref:flavin-containing monooxygenase n=1 Tax=Nocardia sp. NPDC004068 TaxID=3364303 RepID=UPI0036806382